MHYPVTFNSFFLIVDLCYIKCFAANNKMFFLIGIAVLLNC